MKCKNCGVDLVRGFTFCMECGMPVPPEALEESGLPQRNIDSGVQEAFGVSDDNEEAAAGSPKQQEEEITELKPKLLGGTDFTQGEALKPKLFGGSDFTQGEALKPQYISGSADEDSGEALKARYVGGSADDDEVGKGADVKAVMRESSSDDSIGTEKLTFCPNCGMHMQKNPSRCEICGMVLENKPNVPKTSSGIPLFNTGSDSFDAFGGFSGLSAEDAERIDNFANPDPMFDSAPTINAQATPDDFAQLTEQLANFSAGVPTLEVTQSTAVHQQSTPQGEDVQLTDFQLTDDLSDVAIPIYDNGVRVIGDFSLEEDPNADIPDPFAFLQTSLDEPIPDPEPAPSTMPELAPVQSPAPQTAPVAEENTPFIEETPVISETPAPKPVQAALSDIGEPAKPPEIPKAKPSEPKTQTAPTAPIAPSVSQAPSEPKAQTAPTAPQASETENKPQHAPKIPPNMKMCPVCGRQMPSGDKFCPNCGRSMYGGAPSSNNAPAPKKKKSAALIIVLVILLIAAVGVFFYLKQTDALASEILTSEGLQLFYNE